MPHIQGRISFGASITYPAPTGMEFTIAEDGSHHVMATDGTNFCEFAHAESLTESASVRTSTQWRSDVSTHLGVSDGIGGAGVVTAIQRISAPGSSKFVILGQNFNDTDSVYQVLGIRYTLNSPGNISVDGKYRYFQGGAGGPNPGFLDGGLGGASGAAVIGDHLYFVSSYGTFSDGFQTQLVKLPLEADEVVLIAQSWEYKRFDLPGDMASQLWWIGSSDAKNWSTVYPHGEDGVGVLAYRTEFHSGETSSRLLSTVVTSGVHNGLSDISSQFGIPFADEGENFAGTPTSLSDDWYTNPSINVLPDGRLEWFFNRGYSDNDGVIAYRRFITDSDLSNLQSFPLVQVELTDNVGAGFEAVHQSRDGNEVVFMIRENSALTFMSVEITVEDVDCASSGFDLRFPPCVTTFTQCVKIIRRDGVTFRFTSLDRDHEFRGETYVSCGGLDPLATQVTAQIGEVGSSELAGLITTTGVEEHELYCGLFDDAFVEIWLVDYEGSERPRRLAAGWAGKVSHSTRGYRMEVLGPGARLEQRPIVQVYSPQCRWVFGDSRCTVDIESLGVNGTVQSGINRGMFLADFGSLVEGGLVAGAQGYIFDTIDPLSELWVDTAGNDGNPGTQALPLLTIQEAVDRATPGTAIFVNSGNYVENVLIPPSASGTPSAPIWLISVDGQAVDGGSFATVTSPSPSSSCIVIQGAENYSIVGVKTVGGERGFFVTTSGSSHAKNIQFTGCVADGASDDGFKISGAVSDITPAENINVIRCLAENCGGEGIDYLNIDGGVISYNEVRDCASTAAGIFAKSGSDGIFIHHNYVHDIPNGDGISAGGQSSGSATFPYQLANGIIEHNMVELVDQNPFIAKGAINTKIRHNYSDSGSYSPNILITSGTHNGVPLYSSNVEVTGNLLLGTTGVTTIAPSTSNVHDNFTNPGDFTLEPVGPSALAPFVLGSGPLSSGALSSGQMSSGVAQSSGDNVLTGQFTNGRVRWLTGENTGQVNEVKSVDTGSGQIILWALTCHVPQSGDTFRLLPGCAQDFATCQTEYHNTINFGGFPHVPGRDAIMDSPSAKLG